VVLKNFQIKDTTLFIPGVHYVNAANMLNMHDSYYHLFDTRAT